MYNRLGSDGETEQEGQYGIALSVDEKSYPCEPVVVFPMITSVGFASLSDVHINNESSVQSLNPGAS